MVQDLRFRGQQLSPTRKLRLATNNYRVKGGGYRSSEEIREMIIDWVERNKTVSTTTEQQLADHSLDLTRR